MALRWRGFTDGQPGPLSRAHEVADAPFAVLPVGATEQHGSVLPVGTDWLVVTEVATAVGERLGAYVLPTIPVGTSMEHRGSPGTVWLRPSTLAGVVRDVADSLAVWGMTRLAVLSGHGGNIILGPAVRELNTDHPERLAVLVPERVQHGDDGRSPGNLHVGAEETSVGLHLFGGSAPGPESDCVPDAARDELNHRRMLEVAPGGVWGRPSQADAATGERLLEQQVQRVCDFLRGLFL